jgi:Leucine-rich repeat (LRR) protein
MTFLINFTDFSSLNFQRSIKSLPAMVFENLNSLETLSIQNNKLTRIPEDVMEPVIDTLRVVDIMGKFFFSLSNCLLEKGSRIEISCRTEWQ